VQPLLELLEAISDEGNLNRACAKLNISYRHAWGMVREGAELVGEPLVSARRGQPAQLTALGDRLVWANKRIAERLAPVLDNSASELQTGLKSAGSSPAPALRIFASYAFAVAALPRLLQQQHLNHDMRYVNSSDALSALARGACDVAGFHVPLGQFEGEMLKIYAKWLDPRRHALIHMVVRHQGLLVARGNPLGIASLQDLLKPGVRFVNRQPGSGTRLLLNLLLKAARVDPNRIQGFDNIEHTHGAIGAYIASGMADAGPGLETPARQFELGFVPLANERYFLVCAKQILETQPLRTLLATIRSAEYTTLLSEIPGIDSLGCGTVQNVTEVFSSFPHSRVAHI
jgi:molybdate transport repressor ModE-like protein